MSAINLRRMDPALHAALKLEAAQAGVGIEKYCISILESRVPNESVAKALKTVADTTVTAPASPVRQEEPPVLGDWDSEEKQAKADVLSEATRAIDIVKPGQCTHGYLNAKLCAACRAAGANVG